MARGDIVTPAVFYASQSGGSTLDQGDGGGNPFASALIELLDRPSLRYAAFRSDLVRLTKKKSWGHQAPEISAAGRLTRWSLKPLRMSSRRVALVFVYSKYRDPVRQALPGAEHDLKRVAEALSRAGFEVQTAANPTTRDRRAALEALARRSHDAEAAAIYVTGHGFESRGEVYLLPSDYPPGTRRDQLSKRAIHVPGLTQYVRAQRANMVFYGGCRTRW